MFSQDGGLCLVDCEGSDNPLIRVRTLKRAQGKALVVGEKRVPQQGIDKECQAYWEMINEAVESGALADGRQLRGLIAKLMTSGDRIRSMLMDGRTSTALWTLAQTSSSIVLIVPDTLLHVPWEALFYPEAGFNSFLADHTVIARYPEHNDGDTRFNQLLSPNFLKERIVCIDRVLRETIEKQLLDDGETVCCPGDHFELADSVRETRLTHWICEHDVKGLRLDSDRFFTAADTSAHRFPSGSVLMLTSCRSGPDSTDAPAIAARICCFSDCTVIAPSSLIAIDAGVQFVRAINTAIRKATSSLSVADFWRDLGPLRTANREASATDLDPEAWYALWYGIYGDVDRHIKG